MDPTSLPEDILILVLELLGVKELLALSLACRTMHTIVSY
jgi:F-box domain